MRYFTAAFDSWLNKQPDVSLRRLEEASGVDNSLLSQIRKNRKSISLDALTKLLPAVESFSSRINAVTLLLAYLQDVTPTAYAKDIRIEPVDQATGEPTQDTYMARAHEWESKARQDPKFDAVWAGLSDFILHPERLTESIGTPDQQADEIAEAIGAQVVSLPTSQGSIPVLGPKTDYSGLSIAAETPGTMQGVQDVKDAKDAYLKKMSESEEKKPDDDSGEKKSSVG